MQIGENFMNRLTSRFIYDAFFKSFARQPDEAVARNMDLFKKLQEILNKKILGNINYIESHFTVPLNDKRNFRKGVRTAC